MKPKRVMIDEITIGKRHRKEMGDLARLASSIETEGLLQPIGITEDQELVFGQRRIKAVQILGWDRIAAVVVDVSSIAAGEHDENIIRKDFTTMERVAIGKTIEAELGIRQGQRTDLTEPAEEGEELRDSGPGVEPGERNRDIVAQNVGFGSGREYDRAKAVASKGSAKLQRAVDSKTVAVSTAAKLAELPKAQQDKALAGGKEAIKAAVTPQKPKPPYPVFEHFLDMLSNVTFFMGKIEEDYKSLTGFVKHKDWNSKRTPEAAGFLRAVAEGIVEFNQEMEKLCPRK